MVIALGALFRSCRNEIRHSDPERAITFALRTVDGVVTSAIAIDDVSASFGELDDRYLVDDLTRTFVAYLTNRK